MFGTDNGCVFRGDTVEIVAGVSQGGGRSDDKALVADLIIARKDIAKAEMPKKSCICCFGG